MVKINKWWFQFILTSVIWISIFIPFWLPDSITMKSHGTHDVWVPSWDIWAMTGFIILVFAGYEGIWVTTGRLYTWIEKKQKKFNN